MHSGPEMQGALRLLVTRWSDYAGSERSEAQTFLNELFLAYGVDRKDAGAVFEDPRVSTGIVDLHLPGRAIIEMKAPKEAGNLPTHRAQALGYWHSSDDPATDRPAPPYVVLCAFKRFEVWEPGRFPSAPRDAFDLAELPDRYESLLFLAGGDAEAIFMGRRRALTTAAAEQVVRLYESLRDRDAGPPETLRLFVLQLVWCLFAESSGMLEGHPVERIVEDLLRHPERSSYTDLGQLFELLNDRNDYGRHGVYAGTTYVNGALFEAPAKVHLTPQELQRIRDAAGYEWRSVDPTIFGSLMEGFLGRNRRWDLGAHYTHEADILKIVRPTIVRPWQERIDAASSPSEAEQALEELCRFTVLDPACGCGNFLYVAYRELRALEQRAKRRIRSLYRAAGISEPARSLPSYSLRNISGIEVEGLAVLIARLTLWMGHKQAAEAFGMAEPVLPLPDLSSIRVGDALRVPWPRVDAIIGNPPFHGSQHLRRAVGDDYVEWLKQAFGCGVKDYCVYWFRKASDVLAPGQRAGLVATNSISQNRARSASLDYIVANGGVITDAVSTQKWPGEAKVHVSLVNWVQKPSQSPSPRFLDGIGVAGITPELRTAERSTGEVARLKANAGKCFQGPMPVGAGFVLPSHEAAELLARTDGDYRMVVRPFLTGDDIAQDPRQGPRRWIIDFGHMPLEKAMRYPAALEIVRDRVKAERDLNRDLFRRSHWWLLGRPVRSMRSALVGLERWVATPRVGKRLLFAWQTPWTLPSDKAVVLAFDDDVSMGVLSARAHVAWAWSRSSTLKADLNYTPTTAFDTFPWPDPTDELREQISAASRTVIERRQAICVAENIGLTVLYNRVDEGAYTAVRDAHRQLDEAVAAAYGWPAAVAQDDDEIVRRLLALNREIASGTRPYSPFGAAPSAAPTLDLG